jgi:hypothetical protein
VARKQVFLAARWSERFQESYVELSPDRQTACDRAVIALIKRQDSPGLRVKPIQPDKYDSEARIASGDRIVFRTEEGTIFFVDGVKHDDIDRYGRRRRASR